MASNNDGEIILGLDIKKTINTINRDLKMVVSGLKEVKVKASLDTTSIKNINQAMAKARDASKLESPKIQQNIDLGKYINEVTILETKYKKFGQTSIEVESKLKGLHTALANLNDKNQTNKLSENMEKYKRELISTKSQLSSFMAVQVSLTDRTSLSNKMQTWLKTNSAAAKLCGNDINKLASELKTCDAIRFKGINREFDQLKSKARDAGKLGGSFAQTFSKLGTSFVQWVGISGLIMKTIRSVRTMVKYVYEIDTAMISLQKVTDETSSKYQSFLKNSATEAKNLGRTISSLVEQTASWAKLGFSIDDAANLAKTSSVYANVGEVDDVTAVADIVTALKSFNIEAKDSILIVDQLNELGNKFATDSAGLGDGLKNSASALALAGNDINQSLAMITGMTEITQNASESGNAIKILSMRIRGMKGELEKLGEESENVLPVSKIQTQILNMTKGTVNIMDDLDPTKFKATYEIMEDIAKIWDHISEVDQAALLETIAGKQRGNSIAALIKSFQSGQTQKALDVSKNSSGSAYREQEKWMESMEAKNQQLKSAIQGLSNECFDSGLLKFFIDLGTTGTTALTKLIDSIGGLGVAGLALGGILSAKNLGFVNYNSANGFTTFVNRFKKDIPKISQEASKFFKTTKNWDLNALNGDFTNLTNKLKVTDKTLISFLNDTRYGTKDLNNFKSYVQANSKGLTTMAIKTKVASVAMKSLSIATNMALTFGIGLIIQGIVSGIDSLIHRSDKLIEKGQEASKTIETLSTDFQNHKKTVEEIGKRYEDLSKGVDQFSNANKTLTTDEYEEFLNLTGQLAEIFPSLVSGFDGNGNAILNFGDNANAVTMQLKDLLTAEQDLANFKISDNLQDVFNGIREEAKKAQSEIDATIQKAQKAKEVSDILNNPISLDNSIGKDLFQIDTAVAGSEELIKLVETELKNLEKAFTPTTGETGRYDKDGNPIMAMYLSYTELSENELNYIKEKLKTQQADVYMASAESAELLKQDLQSLYKRIMPAIMSDLQTLPSFTGLSDNLQNGLRSAITNIDFSKLTSSDSKNLESYILNNFVYPIASAKPEVQKAYADLFDLKFDGEISVDDYQKQIDNLVKQIAGGNRKEQNKFKIKFGFALESEDGTVEDLATAQIRDIVNRTKEITETELRGLSADQFKIAYDLVVNDGFSGTFAELTQKIKGIGVLDIQQPFNLVETNKDIVETQKKLETMGAILTKLENKDLSASEVGEFIGTMQSEFPQIARNVDSASDSFGSLGQNIREAMKVAITNDISTLTDEIQRLIDKKDELQRTPMNSESLLESSKISDEISALEMMIDGLKELADQKPSIEDLANSIEKATQIFQGYQTILNTLDADKKITPEIQHEILTQYPELLAYMEDEVGLRKELKDRMTEQQDTANELYTTMLENDEAVFNSFLEKEEAKVILANNTINSIIFNNALLVQVLGENYNFDLQNFQSLAQAKAEIETALIQALSKAWADYYSAMQKASSISQAMLAYQNTTDPILLMSRDLFDRVSRPGESMDDHFNNLMQNEIDKANAERNRLSDIYSGIQTDYDKIISELNGLYSNIDIKLPDTTATIGGGSGAGKSAGKKEKKEKDTYSKFSEQIDWIAESIKMLEAEIERYQALLDNSVSEKNKIKYTQLLIDKQTELQAAYARSSAVYKDQYETALSKLSKADQKKVKDGSFTLENFNETIKNDKDNPDKKGAQEIRYENIETALKFRDSFMDSEISISSATTALKEYAKQLADISWDTAQKKIESLTKKSELLDKKIENASGYAEKNKLLEQRLKTEKSILKIQEKALNVSKTNLVRDKNIISLQITTAQKKLKAKFSKNAKLQDDGTYVATKGATKKQVEKIETYNHLQRKVSKIYNGEAISTVGMSPEATKNGEIYNATLNETNENAAIWADLLEDIKTLQNEIWTEKADNIVDDYDMINSSLQADVDKIQAMITLKESAGIQGTKDEFSDLLLIITGQSKNSEEEIKRLRKNIEDAEKSGVATEESMRALNVQLKEAENNLYQCKQALLDTFNSAINAKIEGIQDTIDTLQTHLDSLNATREKQDLAVTGVNNYYDDQIKLIQDEIDAMEKLNDEKDRQLELEKAQANLAKANQLTDKVYTEDKGYVYIANQDAQKSAQEELNDLLFQREVEAKQEEIDKLNEYKDKFNEMVEEYEKARANQYATTLLYNGWESDALNGRLDNFKGFVDSITGTKINIDNTQSMIDTLDNQIVNVQRWADQYKQYALSISTDNSSLATALSLGLNNMGIYTNQYGKYVATSTDTSLQKEHTNTISELNEEEKKSTEDKVTTIGVLEDAKLDSAKTVTELEQDEFNTRLKNLRKFVKETEELYARLVLAQAMNAIKNNFPIKGIGGGFAEGKDKINGKAGIATVAEVQPEILVRDGKSYLLENPQLLNVKANDIILNGKETEEILAKKNEHLVPLGNAFFNGNIALSNTPKILKDFNINPNVNNVIKPIADNSIKITMGDIKVEGVQDADEFARAIKQNYPSIVKQQLYRK